MRHLPDCPLCGGKVHIEWDDKTRTAAICHEGPTICHEGPTTCHSKEFRSCSRKQTAEDWTAWVSHYHIQQLHWNAPMVWNGFNAEQVVTYCVTWQKDLCPGYSIARGKNDEPELVIEPTDLMRSVGLRIPLNSKVMRCGSRQLRYHHHTVDGCNTYIRVWPPEILAAFVERDWPPKWEKWVCKIDRKHFKMDTPSAKLREIAAANIQDKYIQRLIMEAPEPGLPIGCYSRDWAYSGCPEPWPNPLRPKAFSLFPDPSGLTPVPMTHGAGVDGFLFKPMGNPET